MTVKELIAQLKRYNPDYTVGVDVYRKNGKREYVSPALYLFDEGKILIIPELK